VFILRELQHGACKLLPRAHGKSNRKS
jgi:hypothetical protein